MNANTDRKYICPYFMEMSTCYMSFLFDLHIIIGKQRKYWTILYSLEYNIILFIQNISRNETFKMLGI